MRNAEFTLHSRYRTRNRWVQAECGLRTHLAHPAPACGNEMEERKYSIPFIAPHPTITMPHFIFLFRIPHSAFRIQGMFSLDFSGE
jgi:hypothetical protein